MICYVYTIYLYMNTNTCTHVASHTHVWGVSRFIREQCCQHKSDHSLTREAYTCILVLARHLNIGCKVQTWYMFNLCLHDRIILYPIFRKKADIAPLLDVEDMVRMKKPDWKCVFTYVQSFYRKLRDHENNKHTYMQQ